MLVAHQAKLMCRPSNESRHAPGKPAELGARAAARHHEPVEPNLARIPADGDARAEAILLRVQGLTGQHLLDSLDERDALALGRYGVRQPTVALREGSVRRLHDGLLATALCQLIRRSDPRDLMVGLAVHHVLAKNIGVVPSALFEEIAARLPDGPVSDLLRGFGSRQDITPEAFGWQLVQTPGGPDFMPG